MNLEIREFVAEDVAKLAAVDGGNGWNLDPSLWKRYEDEHRCGLRTVFIAWFGAAPAGYASLTWHSNYDHFAQANIPEINKLVVAKHVRGRGIATRLIQECEAKAKAHQRAVIGIGFGLYADYGSAQRLYARLGYQPVGMGATYKGQKVEPGENVRLDDDLIFWMTKVL